MKIKKKCVSCGKRYVVAEMRDQRVVRIVKTNSYSYCQTCTESKVKETK